MPSFRAIVSTPNNRSPLTISDYNSLEYVLSTGRPTVALLDVGVQVDPTRMDADYRLYPQRSTSGGGWALDADACFLIRIQEQTNQGTTVTAYHVNELLARRVVAYNSGSTFAVKTTDEAGNLVKQFARENIGTSVSTANRDGSTDTGTDLVTDGLLTIAADLNDGANTVKTADRKSLLQVMQEIADDSATLGTYLTFNIVARLDGTLVLTTKPTTWGRDKRPYSLAEGKYGLSNLKITKDYSREVNVAIAAGRGIGDNRLIQVAYDTTSIIRTPFNRREAYVDVPAADTATAVLAMAESRLRERRAVIQAEAELVDHPGSTRGVDYDVGDVLVVKTNFGGRPVLYEMRLETVMVSAKPGSSTVKGLFRSLT
jgi:hypothetical protein